MERRSDTPPPTGASSGCFEIKRIHKLFPSVILAHELPFILYQILDEPFIYHAARHYLARHGLRVPEDLSLVCTDGHPTFVWCRPSVAHIRWDERPVLRRIVRWANNIARGRDDRRQTDTKAEFVDGGTVGPVPKR